MSKPGDASFTPSFEVTREVRDRCLCLHAQRAARVLGRRFDAAFRPLGVTHGQFSLMLALNRPEPPPLGAVAALLAIDRTTLTAALKPLGRRGLVTVTAGADDRRSRRAALTDAGRALLGRAVPIWRAQHDAIDRALAAAGEAGLPLALGGLPGLLGEA